MHVIQKDKMVTNSIRPLVTYQGLLTQDLISDMLETIEFALKDDDMSKGFLSHISIIFIELCQNMINYSKNDREGSEELNPYGFIKMYKSLGSNYILSSKNIVSINDKKRILTRLLDINILDKDEVKQRYKELRRNAKHSHNKGAGIGLYDIAKRCDTIEYSFESINDSKFYFSLSVEIEV